MANIWTTTVKVFLLEEEAVTIFENPSNVLPLN